MADSPELNIDRVAELARIALTPDEKAVYAAQLGEVLKHVEQLKQVNVDGTLLRPVYRSKTPCVMLRPSDRT
jgi:aspartyl/glutamyl-tRNA(Asn/Gln) amidotransferase C subunit